MGLKEQKETLGMELKSGPAVKIIRYLFFLKKLVSSVESSRVSPVAFLARIFWKLDYPLSGTCFDLLSDTIIVSYDLHYSLTSVEPLAAWSFTRVRSTKVYESIMFR